MPNTKSAIRRTKRTEIQTSVNRIRKSKYKAAIKLMNGYIETGKIKEAKNAKNDGFPPKKWWGVAR